MLPVIKSSFSRPAVVQESRKRGQTNRHKRGEQCEKDRNWEGVRKKEKRRKKWGAGK